MYSFLLTKFRIVQFPFPRLAEPGTIVSSIPEDDARQEDISVLGYSLALLYRCDILISLCGNYVGTVEYHREVTADE